MCGICGFSGFHIKELIERMSSAISHRGPNQHGFYFAKNITLGHQRLSIIDLSENGRQPMSNEDSTIHLVCNGEIYNYLSLREGLEEKGHQFKSNSDNEVIIHAYEELGIECVNLFRGMFVFAIWDSKKEKLFLARDRFGIKPLYYTQVGDRFIFASEIKAMLEDESIKRKINEDAFYDYLIFQYVPNNETIFKGINKLPPGHTLVYKDGKMKLDKYWRLNRNSIKDSYTSLSLTYCIEKLKHLLEESIKIRLISDVPLGILLSGGLDSSSIVANLPKDLDGPINTFTVGFNQHDEDLKFAKLVSSCFSTNHKDYIFSQQNLIEELPEVVWHMDEPIADGGMLATYWIAKFVKKYATVVLVGEGADEILAGYPWHRIASYQSKFLPKSLKIKLWSHLISGILDRKLFSKVVSLQNRRFHQSIKDIFDEKNHDLSLFDQILDFEIQSQLPNQLLMKVDKMMMAHSVEARVPYLDHLFYEFASSLPAKLKCGLFNNKIILRKAMSSVLPEKIANRKKRGMLLPLRRWLNSDLGQIALRMLTHPESYCQKYLSKVEVENLFSKNAKLNFDLGYGSFIWRIFIFEIWHSLYIKGQSRDSLRNELKYS